MQHVISGSFSKRLYSNFSKVTLAIGIALFISGCGEKTAEDHFQDAAAFVQSGDNTAAVVALKNAVQIAPTMAKARFELGKAQLALYSYESASKELARALEFGHPQREVIPLLAEALQRSGANVALADLNYNPSLLTPELQLEVGYRKTQALIGLNKQDESKALINQLLASNENTIYRSMIDAFALAIDERYPEALENLKRELKSAPLNRDLIGLTARMYILNGDPTNASKLYQDYIKVAKDDLEAKFSLANMLIQQQQPQEAEVYIDQLLSVNPTNGLLNQLKAVVRASAEDFKSAQQYAETAINSGRSDFNVRLIAGIASFQLQDHESTIKHLTVVAGSLPDNHPALRMLAASQLELNKGKDAGDILSRISDVSADDLSLFSRTGYELIKTGDTQTAKEIIKQASKVAESSEELTKLGVLRLSLDDIEGIVDLESAVAKAPLSANAKATLAGAYLSTNNLPKASLLARQWQKAEPNNVEGYMLEAEVLQRQGFLADAARVIQTAKNIDGDSPSVKLASIRLAIREQNFEKGLAETEAFLVTYPNDVTALASYFAITSTLGDPSKAISKIEVAAQNNVNNEPLVLLASRIMLSINKVAPALDLLNNITPTRLTPSSYWEVKGEALLLTNNNEQAYAHYRQWVDYFPNDVGPTVGLLRTLDAQGNYPQAAQIAAEFSSQHNNVQVTLMHAYFLAMSSDARSAKRVLNSVDNQYKTAPFVRGIKARIALLEGRGEDAVEDAKASYTENKSPENLIVYAQTIDSTGQSERAFSLIEQHVQEFPNDARSRALLAERQVAKDPSAALNTYESMLKDYPENPVLLNNASYLHLQANNLEKALQYSRKAVSLRPKNMAFADTYAQVIMRRGDAAQAVEVYNSVITPSVTDETIILNYIEALLENDDSSTAKRKIEEFKSKLRSQESRARLLALQSRYLS